MPPLIATLAHDDHFVRMAAAVALAEMGHKAQPAIPALVNVFINDNHLLVRISTSAALRRISTAPPNLEDDPLEFVPLVEDLRQQLAALRVGAGYWTRAIHPDVGQQKASLFRVLNGYFLLGHFRRTRSARRDATQTDGIDVIGWDPVTKRIARWQFRSNAIPRQTIWDRNVFLPGRGVGKPHRTDKPRRAGTVAISAETKGDAPELLRPFVGNWKTPPNSKQDARITIQPMGIGVLARVERNESDVPNMLVFIVKDGLQIESWMFDEQGSVVQSRWEQKSSDNSWFLKSEGRSSNTHQTAELAEIEVVDKNTLALKHDRVSNDAGNNLNEIIQLIRIEPR